MSDRISKRVRNDAALLCALMASSSEHNMPQMPAFNFAEACGVVGTDVLGGTADLARAALRSFPWGRYATDSDSDRADWAEAEALLRTGWTP